MFVLFFNYLFFNTRLSVVLFHHWWETLQTEGFSKWIFEFSHLSVWKMKNQAAPSPCQDTLVLDVQRIMLDSGGCCPLTTCVSASCLLRSAEWLVASDWLESLWSVRWCRGQCPWSSPIEAWFLPLRVQRRCDPALMHHLGLHSTTFQICAKTKQFLVSFSFEWDYLLLPLGFVFFLFSYHFSCFISPNIVQLTHVCRMNFIPHLLKEESDHFLIYLTTTFGVSYFFWPWAETHFADYITAWILNGVPACAVKKNKIKMQLPEACQIYEQQWPNIPFCPVHVCVCTSCPIAQTRRCCGRLLNYAFERTRGRFRTSTCKAGLLLKALDGCFFWFFLWRHRGPAAIQSHHFW